MKNTHAITPYASNEVIDDLSVLQQEFRSAGNEIQRFENEGGKTLTAAQILKRDDCFKSSLRIKKLMHTLKQILSPIAA